MDTDESGIKYDALGPDDASPLSAGITELNLRMLDAQRSLHFGVPYLDDALNGILPRDLIVIGARTGAGKSELAVKIAQSNAAQSKSVTLFALEADANEMRRRLTYQIVAEQFFAHRTSFPSDIHLNFTDWRFHRYQNRLEVLDHFAIEKYRERYLGLTIISPEVTTFSKRSFALTYEEAAYNGSSMVILDHIHYISADDRENEYEHTKKTMWRLRDLINKHEVPVVALSHLRKEDRANKSLLPTTDELHGSSEISKQANHVISLGPIYSLPDSSSCTGIALETPPGTTGMRVLKTRTGHRGADRYVGVTNFGIENVYEDRYVPYKTDHWSTKLTPVGRFEHWMTRAREARK